MPKGIRVVFSQANVCELEPFDLSELQPGPGEILVQAQRSLISQGTELIIFTGKHSNQQRPGSWTEFPFLPGYSVAGTVLIVGMDVTQFKPGDRVFVNAKHASHSLMPAVSAIPIPSGVSAEQAAFAELGAIALNGIRLGAVALGEAVLAAGQGLVGLLALRLARLAGARPLFAVDLSQDRLALAVKWGGADAALDPRTTDPATALRAQNGNRLADVVIEATGNPAVVAGCLPWVRDGGRVVLLGSPHGKVEINFYEHVHRRNLRLVGGHLNASQHPCTDQDPWNKERHQQLFLDLMARGDLSVGELITHRVSPRGLPDLYKLAAAQPGAVLGAIVNWEETK